MILYLEDWLCNQIYVALIWTSSHNRSSILGNSAANEYQWHVADASWRHAMTLTSAPVLANLGLSRINRQLSLPYLTSSLSISLPITDTSNLPSLFVKIIAVFCPRPFVFLLVSSWVIFMPFYLPGLFSSRLLLGTHFCSLVYHTFSRGLDLSVFGNTFRKLLIIGWPCWPLVVLLTEIQWGKNSKCGFRQKYWATSIILTWIGYYPNDLLLK